MSKGLVTRATSDDVKPVTGLQLKNLADATLDIKECDTIREALLSRLEDDSPFVKQKVLRIIKYVCQHGKTDFRMELQRGDGNKLIKDCLQYKGTPHETRGDAPNAAVREEAKGALAAIFGAGADQTTGTGGQQSRENIVGFGSSGASFDAPGASGGGGAGAGASDNGGYGAGTYGGNVSINVSKSGNMIGFGNPAFENQKEGKGILDTIKDAVVGSDGAPFKPWAQPGPYQGAGAGYGPGQYAPNPHTPPTSFTAKINHATQPISSAAPAGGRKKGQVGGAWEAEPAGAVPNRNGGGGGGGGGYRNDDPYANSSPAAATSGGGNYRGAGGDPPRAHTGGGEFEKKLVNEIVQPSGVRSFPTPAELSAFVKKCQSLDAYDIATLLDAKLAADVLPASQLKALSVLDALLSSESADGALEYFREHANDAAILAHEQSAAVAIRKQALVVLRRAGLRAPEPVAAAAPHQQQQHSYAPVTAAPAASSNAPLFEFSNVPQAASTAAATSTSVAAATSLFGELTVKSTPAPAPSAAAAAADFFMAQPAVTHTPTPAPVARPQAQPQASSEDPFSALIGMTKPTATTAPAPTPASSDPYAALYAKKPAPQVAASSNPYAALTGFGGATSTSANAHSNLNFLSNSNSAAKNYNFTVTAARPTGADVASPAKAQSNSIDPFANAFRGPVPSSAPPPAANSNSSGFGFIAADSKADPFGSLIQLK